MENATPGSGFLALHGVGLRLDDVTPTQRRALETVAEYHGFRPAPPISGAWTWTEGDASARPADALFVAAHASGLALWRDGDDFLLEHGAGTLRVSPALRQVQGALPRSKKGADSEFYVATTLALLLMLESAGFYALHAACLVSPEGDGVLVVGPSDTGKSTMALHLVGRGWQYLSDDSVLLFDENGRVGVRPLRRDFCVDPDAETLFPDLAGGHEHMLTDADKWRVRVEGLYPDQSRAACFPALLLFPTIAPQPESQVAPLRPAAAMLALLPQAALLARDARSAAAFTRRVETLVRQAPAYTLRSGRDIHGNGAALETLFLTLLESNRHAEKTPSQPAHDRA